jgi:transposase
MPVFINGYTFKKPYIKPIIPFYFYPPDSPELNPIEHKWAQAKAIRKQKHCSVSELLTLSHF